MVEKHVTPTIASASFNCPHCGVLTHQTWYNLLASQIEGKGLPELPLPDPAKVLAASLAALQTPRAKPPSPDAFRPKQAFVGGTLMADTHCPKVENLFASVCYTCGAVSIWVGERLMFPPARHGEEPNFDLPQEVVRDYDEARSIVDLSPRGAAALLRLCVQKLCKHLGESGKNIDNDIAALVKKGLDPKVQQALDIVRVIGNEAVHPGELDLRDDRATASKLFTLVNLISDRLITAPKRVEEMYKGLPEPKRKAIDARDKSK